MQFYSGFSLCNEQHFFESYLDTGAYSVAGFSYGSIQALHTTIALIESGKRVDRLQLLSPAFFQTKSQKFKRLQLMAYKKSEALYLKQFIRNCFSPYESLELEHSQTSSAQLQELLSYEWLVEKLQKLQDAGVKIEVYLGGKDAIIDVAAAKEFFLAVATVTYMKDANHFLQLN